MVAGLGGPVGVDLRVERPVGQIDAVQRVGQRGGLELVRAHQRVPYHARSWSRTCGRWDLEGQQAFGRDGVLDSSYAMMDGEPQKSQRWAARSDRKREMAWQLWHFTGCFLAAQPARGRV